MFFEEFLCKMYGTMNETFHGMNLLKNAISNNSVNECSKLLQTNYIQSGLRLCAYQSAILALAIRKEREEIFKLILNSGIKVDGLTVLTVARLGKIKYFKLLLQHAPEVLKNDEIILYFYAQGNICHRLIYPIGICKLMIKNGACYKSKKHSYLTSAINCGNYDVIDTLLFYGVNPLEEYIDEYDESCCIPIQNHNIYSLSSSAVENIIKFAALHIQSNSNQNLKDFYKNFSKGNARSYLKFAQSCVAEINILKSFTLNSNNLNLFDFLLSQDDKLQQLLDVLETVNDTLKILTSISLPIYKGCILRKFKKKDILQTLTDFSYMKYCRNSCGKKISLDLYSVEKIHGLLPKTDLISLWLAFTNM